MQLLRSQAGDSIEPNLNSNEDKQWNESQEGKLMKWQKKKKCLLPSDRAWVLCIVGMSTWNSSVSFRFQVSPRSQYWAHGTTAAGFCLSPFKFFCLFVCFRSCTMWPRPCRGCQHDIISKLAAGEFEPSVPLSFLLSNNICPSQCLWLSCCF